MILESFRLAVIQSDANYNAKATNLFNGSLEFRIAKNFEEASTLIKAIDLVPNYYGLIAFGYVGMFDQLRTNSVRLYELFYELGLKQKIHAVDINSSALLNITWLGNNPEKLLKYVENI